MQRAREKKSERERAITAVAEEETRNSTNKQTNQQQKDYTHTLCRIGQGEKLSAQKKQKK